MSSKGKLLVSDMMNHWMDGIWWMAHPTKTTVTSPANQLQGTQTDMVWWRYAPRFDYPPNLPLHAGYTDGHVDRYYSEETLFIDIYAGNRDHRFHFPKEWR